MNAKVENGTESDLMPGQRMGKIGAELIVKAAICAAAIAVIAGMVAVLFGS